MAPAIAPLGLPASALVLGQRPGGLEGEGGAGAVAQGESGSSAAALRGASRCAAGATFSRPILVKSADRYWGQNENFVPVLVFRHAL